MSASVDDWLCARCIDDNRHTADADATQLSSWVASAVCTQFAAIVGDSLDESEQICQQRSRVASCRRCERTRQQSWPSLSCAVELLGLVTDKWRHNDVIVEKVINIDQNSRTQTAMFSFQIVDRIRRQSSWANCELCSHRRRRRDIILQMSRVGGVYWAWWSAVVVRRSSSESKVITMQRCKAVLWPGWGTKVWSASTARLWGKYMQLQHGGRGPGSPEPFSYA